MSFKAYLRQLCTYVISSSVVLGAFLGIANLIAGVSTANVDLEFELGGFGGMWLIPGLPAITVLVFMLLSPLSFWIHRLLTGKGSAIVPPGS